ncbi:MAG: ribonuclease HII, partial [Rhodothermia bacterium]
VILPPDRRIRGVRDSKILSCLERERLARVIRRNAVAIGIGICTIEEIDRMNILRASLEAMQRALKTLTPFADYALVDGNQPLPEPPCPFKLVVGGDDLCYVIAASSIIAKVERDRIMVELHEQHPDYQFASNKGYGTPEHYDVLELIGPSPCHRRSFRLKREHADQTDLFAEARIERTTLSTASPTDSLSRSTTRSADS